MLYSEGKRSSAGLARRCVWLTHSRAEPRSPSRRRPPRHLLAWLFCKGRFHMLAANLWRQLLAGPRLRICTHGYRRPLPNWRSIFRRN